MDDLDFLISGIDLDFDFDLGDFDLITDGAPVEKRAQRILKPRVDLKLIDTRLVAYDNAKSFAADISLEPNARTYAWVDGSFVFGDIMEALCEIGHPVRRAWLTSLGISEENIDSFYNCFELHGLEKLCLLLSGYFYSHEKWKLIPYMYNTLDIELETEPDHWEPAFQVGFFNMHAKVMCLELYDGTKLTIHGSSNLRSSNSVEQICAETDPQLFDFNVTIIREFMRRYYTINHEQGVGKKMKALRENYTGQIIRDIKGGKLWHQDHQEAADAAAAQRQQQDAAAAHRLK